MPEFQLSTPVAFIIFNRPDTTARVFAEIAKAKPPKLLVVADGARPSREGEAEQVAQTRAIIEGVDWPCEVLTNFSDTNLGCKKRVSSGIDWIFEQVEEAIILEDDCLPESTFFRFCEEMLARYRHDERISMISGNNFLFGQVDIPESYYFSRYMHIWGWASWRRAWKDYDVNMTDWSHLRSSGMLEHTIQNRSERQYWLNAFDGVKVGKIDTWDYQWGLSCWVQSRIAVMPAVNLISNIGFGPGATHTKGASIFSAMSTQEIDFPLHHPKQIFPNLLADGITAKNMFTTSLPRKIINKAAALINNIKSVKN